jgi:hypothetical protein
MYCKKCGEQIDNDSIFCNYCGKKQSINLILTAENESQSANSTNHNQFTNENKSFNTTRSQNLQLYDSTYKKETDAVIIGVVLLVYPIIIAISIASSGGFESENSFAQFKGINIIISILVRISVTFSVVYISKRQNREPLGWGIFAFILPSIALITIGNMKKLFANIEIVEEFDNKQNSKLISDKAQDFFLENKLSESIRFAKKAIELDSNNVIAKDILSKSEKSINDSNKSENSETVIIKRTTDNKILKIISNTNEIIGSIAFIDETPVNNGIYVIPVLYQNNYSSIKLIIQNGYVTNQYYIEKIKNFFDSTSLYQYINRLCARF